MPVLMRVLMPVLMKSSRHWVVAAAALGVVWLHPGVVAVAQEAPAEPGSPDARRMLEDVVDVREGGNEAGAEVQQRIEAVSDETDELLAEYRTTLKQIDSLNLFNDQISMQIQAQQAELASLEEQLGRVQEVARAVTPLMIRMIEALEKFVQLDVPFLIEERTKRVAELREYMGRADISTAEKFRQIMEAYQIENEYGRTIEAYRAPLKLDGRESTVDFLRFGRIALVYQALDESESGVWDQQTRSWVRLDSSYRSGIRQGLRIARKQAAPDLVRLPLPAPRDARGSS